MITYLEPDILECEVKWALESITTNKASGGDGIPVELFQILKDDAVKVLHSICQQIWKAQQWPQDWKRSVFIPIPKKGNAKECSNYHTIALFSHASKAMLKILQARLQQYVNRELPDVQAGFRKGRGPEIKLPTSAGSWKKASKFQKNIYFCFIDYAKPLTVWITITVGNSERCCESAALNMPANLESSAVATGLEKVSFHSNRKERQCQRMLKLPHNCTHLTC